MDVSPASSRRRRPPVETGGRPWPVLSIAAILCDLMALAGLLDAVRGVALRLVPARALTLGPIGWHLMAAVLVGLAFPGWRAPAGATAGHRCLGPIALALALCFPLVGAGAMLVVSLWMARRTWHPIQTLEEYQELVDQQLAKTVLLEDVRPSIVERSFRAMEMAPFGALVATQKEGAVIDSVFRSALLLERGETCRLLREAMASDVALTRYYASTTLARIEEGMDRTLMECEKAVSEAPGDPVRIQTLADARFAYTQVNPPDDAVARFHLDESIRLYTACLVTAGAPADHPVRSNLARALLAAGRAQEALAHYSLLIEHGSKEASVLSGGLRAALAAGDLAALGRHMQRMLECHPDSQLSAALLRAWARPGAPPTPDRPGEATR